MSALDRPDYEARLAQTMPPARFAGARRLHVIARPGSDQAATVPTPTAAETGPQTLAADPALQPVADYGTQRVDDARNIGHREGYRQGYVDGFRYGVVCRLMATIVAAALIGGAVGLAVSAQSLPGTAATAAPAKVTT